MSQSVDANAFRGTAGSYIISLIILLFFNVVVDIDSVHDQRLRHQQGEQNVTLALGVHHPSSDHEVFFNTNIFIVDYSSVSPKLLC